MERNVCHTERLISLRNFSLERRRTKRKQFREPLLMVREKTNTGKQNTQRIIKATCII